MQVQLGNGCKNGKQLCVRCLRALVPGPFWMHYSLSAMNKQQLLNIYIYARLSGLVQRLLC